MKKLIFVVLYVFMCSATFAQDNFSETDKAIDLINNISVELKDTFLKECPFRHREIKRVPIMAGMLAFDADFQKKIDDLEVWPAGCIVGEEKYRVVCVQCRYAYNPYNGYWVKEGSDAEGFQIDPDSSMVDFLGFFKKSFKTDAIDAIHFTQSVKSRRDYTDRLTFFIIAKQKDILRNLKEYFAQGGIQPKENIIREIDSVYYDYENSGKAYKIGVVKSVNKYEIITYEVIHKVKP